jgi:predicted nucleotidyltransferase
MLPTERERVVESVRRFFAVPPPGTVAVYVFGSFGRDTATNTSDVDVAVLVARDPARTLDGLCSDLQDRLQEALDRPVDIIVLNHASADLVHRVLRDGLLVCETNRGARIAFEIRCRNDYFDLEPIRQRYRHPSAPGVASR